MMNSLFASCFAEYLKIRRSKVLWLTIAALCLAPIFGALFVIVLRNPSLAGGNEALRAKAALSGFSPDWPSFFNLIAQAVGVGGVIVFGFIASWIFGREYSDHTIKDLFALPTNRSTIVVSKLIACLAWCFVVALAVIVVALVTGFLLSLPGWNYGLFYSSLAHIFFTAILAASLCPPVFFLASAGRGYLASLGFVVLTVVFAQIIGAIGYGAYVPWAVPALYSGLGSDAGGSLGFASYALVALTGIAGQVATIYWWKYADQEK
jgi:ABC-type transport system involved in multi-copper enzyme maturation permease subunit